MDENRNGLANQSERVGGGPTPFAAGAQQLEGAVNV